MVRTVDFAFSDEQIAIRNTARAFIADEIITREAEALRRERQGESAITRAELRDLQHAAGKFGFWGLSTPQQYGGMELPAVTEALLWAETGRSFIPFRFGGSDDPGLARLFDHRALLCVGRGEHQDQRPSGRR
jgi:alkylation response protein AidB-like acyl-CoA dehydrogenase